MVKRKVSLLPAPLSMAPIDLVKERKWVSEESNVEIHISVATDAAVCSLIPVSCPQKWHDIEVRAKSFLPFSWWSRRLDTPITSTVVNFPPTREEREGEEKAIKSNGEDARGTDVMEWWRKVRWRTLCLHALFMLFEWCLVWSNFLRLAHVSS